MFGMTQRYVMAGVEPGATHDRRGNGFSHDIKFLQAVPASRLSRSFFFKQPRDDSPFGPADAPAAVAAQKPEMSAMFLNFDLNIRRRI
jgi:hypothetical protein